jgi:drug/metabolite transporter (DMT)-like permease
MRKGLILLVLADFCFAAATVFVKYASTGTQIPAIEVSFARFFVGFFIAGFAMLKTGQSFKPNKTKLVIWRAILNTIALIFFFLSVKYTSITNANMLNMTYPVFIFLFAPFMVREKISRMKIFYLCLTMLGIYLVINPNFNNINIGDWYGLLSGISGAVAIITLRMAREYDTTALIIFYLMTIGMLINGVILIPFFVLPDQTEMFAILASAVLGVAGQVLLTSGYRHVETSKGSLISSSRIIFAVIFGVTLFAELISIKWMIGCLLILTSLAGVSFLKQK